MPEVLKPDADSSEERILTKAAQILIDGGIFAYPTETFYGLGADATNEKAIQNIFAVKGRDFKSPISLIVGRPDAGSCGSATIPRSRGSHMRKIGAPPASRVAAPPSPVRMRTPASACR